MLQMQRALFGGAEVTIRRLIDPQAVGIEVCTDRDLRQSQFATGAQRRDQLGGQEMGVDHQVPLLVLQEALEGTQVEFLHGLSQSIARAVVGLRRPPSSQS